MVTTQRRDRGLEKSLSASLNKQIKESRILLVGAGGIGCEVLKNLVCCGFGCAASRETQNEMNGQNGVVSPALPGITIVDLDTIDLSNLNRQFLFRARHIKKPKAFVAKETASAFNPTVNIDARHASIFDEQYNVEFFESFDIVFNALDNVPARRHVNKMCLAANVPLIESGTTGYNGQVQSIKKGLTECYDCNEKPVQKSYAICTIRSTPSQPIHCIVWAKSYLLPELFGVSEDQSDMKETTEDNAEEVEKLKQEAQALKKIRNSMGEPGFAQSVFDKVYEEDIVRLASMTDMWKSKKPPEPLRFRDNIWTDDPVTRGTAIALREQDIWTMEENAAVFCSSLDALKKRVQEGETTIEFDKDDKDTLDFVTAAANLRAHIFGITLNSEWQIKQMAGNIIPAIATSNAMTASLCVMQAFKIMRGFAASAAQNGHGQAAVLGGSKMTFLTSKNTERMISTERLSAPKPGCPTCSLTYAKLLLPAAEAPTIQDLADLLKTTTGLEEFAIMIDKGLIYDPDEQDNADKPLSNFGISAKSNGFVTVSDDDGTKVDLVLSMTATDGELAIQPSSIELPDKVKPPVEEPVQEPAEQPDTATTGMKRKRDAEDTVVVKRPKVAAGGDPVVIDDPDDGTILLDD
ncbi:hypothetical protein AMS68_004371 [Peltaster fructicola]|uniref:Ubiquitin-activating enzyme E1-like n=1 Tax=Peltaster fructicola TaxID=286661 RepID=A0A6H0XVV5_9PEZI|nr:hypothetical protein AMS68_004371 [Peltaster fructicola]